MRTTAEAYADAEWSTHDDAPSSIRRSPRVLVGDRRASRRLPIEIDVDFEGGAHHFCATTADLSTGGLFVMTSADVPVGAQVALGLHLPNGASLQVVGVVTWRRGHHTDGAETASPGLGVMFFCLEPAAKEVLEGFCSVREPLYCDVASVLGDEAEGPFTIDSGVRSI